MPIRIKKIIEPPYDKRVKNPQRKKLQLDEKKVR